VYLAWVIKIQAVQCHRAAATDDSIEKFLFFDAGCRPGLPAHFQWNLDTWDAFPPGPFASVITPVSIPMQRAWNAAVAAFKELIKALANGELIANGLHPVSGVRSDLDPAEWTCAGLTLDVRNGILYEERNGKHVLWSAITLRAAKQARQKKERGHAYDWGERGPTQQPYAPRTSGIGHSIGGTRSSRRPSRTRSRNGSRRGAVFQISATFAATLQSRSMQAGARGANASVE
jgi:hypothetical protein